MSTDLAAIPFLNLSAANGHVAAEIQPLWDEILTTGGFIGGPFVAQFEREFADFTGARFTVGVANGTDALTIALRALGVGRGDEVIVPAQTFAATVEAVEWAGGVPVLSDVDRATATIDPAAVEAAVSSRTRAIVPVHLYGQPADMAGIGAVAERHGLVVLEDAAQAHGATYQGRPAGSLGDAAAFSFYPAKNLGACGDAGAVTTDRSDVAAAARSIGDHGQTAKYDHQLLGMNSRVDALQAAALVVKLAHLPKWNRRRQAIAALYGRLLDEVDVVLPVTAPDRTHVFHLFVIRHPERDRLREGLAGLGVGVGLHYPQPVHLLPAFAHLGYRAGAFPEAEAWAAECLSLPMCPELEDHQIEAVATRLKSLL